MFNSVRSRLQNSFRVLLCLNGFRLAASVWGRLCKSDASLMVSRWQSVWCGDRVCSFILEVPSGIAEGSEEIVAYIVNESTLEITKR